jgi:hypothetical protein
MHGLEVKETEFRKPQTGGGAEFIDALVSKSKSDEIFFKRGSASLADPHY